MVKENKATSSSSSPSPKPDQKHKSIVVAVEEKETRNNLKQGVPEEVASEKTTTERPRFQLGVVRTERDMTKKYPPNNNLVYMCNFCNLRFPSSHALCGHIKSHRYERELQRQRNMKELSHNSYQAKPNSIFGGCSSSDNHLRLSPCSSKPIGGGSSNVSLWFNSGVPIGVTSMNMARVTPYPTLTRKTSNGGGSSSNGGVTRGGITDTNMTVVPPADPYGFLTNNTSYSTKSPHALSDDNHLELSLGPFKSKGGSSVYPCGVTRGNTEPNLSVVPRLTPYQLVTGNTSYVSSWNPIPSSVYNPHDSIITNVPPPPTTNISNDLCSLEENLTSTGEENKVMVLEDDDKDSWVIEDHEDDDEDQLEDGEAESWGRDLSLSL